MTTKSQNRAGREASKMMESMALDDVNNLSEKQKALAAFEKRKANPPEQVDNSSLYAGSPMYYYCRMCGHQSDVLPESHLSRPRQLCIDCQLIKDMGWFD